MYNLNPRDFIFKIVRGLFDIAIYYLEIFLSSLLMKILLIAKNGISSHRFLVLYLGSLLTKFQGNL